MKRQFILLILDGWGIGKEDESNPIHVVDPPNIKIIKSRFPSGALQASSVSVGLPWGEEGNSEVGHLNMGAGKTVYQHYPRITTAIRDRTFFENPVLKKAIAHAKNNDSAVNLVGLLSAGNVHASLEHLKALIKFTEEEGANRVNLHLFSDGRDSPPKSVLKLISEIPAEKLASLSGRFYAMDRDQHFERTERAYRVLTGDEEPTNNLEEHIKKTYSQNLNDEYIEPVMIGPQKRPIKENDAVIFFNFREDRMRQIASAFLEKDFKEFPVKSFNNVHIVTMTRYDQKFDAPIAFEPELAENPLGRVLSDAGKTQFRIAETQKYAHITYFFNGLREDPFPGEYRVLIPSRPILHQDEHPEMRASEIVSRLIEAINEGAYDFLLANLANPDMIAHTGNYEACLEAVRAVDKEIGRIMSVAEEKNAVLIITSDHGNIERVLNPLTGETETQHDPNPVPIYIMAKEYERPRTEKEIKEAERAMIGILADVAPTILELMGLKQPKEMTGQSLIKFML